MLCRYWLAGWTGLKFAGLSKFHGCAFADEINGLLHRQCGTVYQEIAIFQGVEFFPGMFDVEGFSCLIDLLHIDLGCLIGQPQIFDAVVESCRMRRIDENAVDVF